MQSRRGIRRRRRRAREWSGTKSNEKKCNPNSWYSSNHRLPRASLGLPRLSGCKKWIYAWHVWFFSPKWPFLMPPRRSENLRRFFSFIFLVFFSVYYCLLLLLTLDAVVAVNFLWCAIWVPSCWSFAVFRKRKIQIRRLSKWLKMRLNQPWLAAAEVALPDSLAGLSARSVATDKTAVALEGLLLLFQNTSHRLAFGSRTPETATNVHEL